MLCRRNKNISFLNEDGSEDRVKLRGYIKNFSFLNEDGFCTQGKTKRQYPKQGRYPKTGRIEIPRNSVSLSRYSSASFYTENCEAAILNKIIYIPSETYLE
ncbi:UNVERIFIED_CONTAM: hypothetical protein NCL1_16241 [Trichonephila clavipes]